MTGLLELIGIIFLFGVAPICAWRWWVHLEELQPGDSRAETEAVAGVAEPVGEALPGRYDELAS